MVVSIRPVDESRAVSNVVPVDAEILEKVLISGDLSDLKPTERVVYYRGVCQSLGLNWLTKPFEYLELDKKLILYATKNCAEQLRMRHGVSLEIVGRSTEDGVHTVTARATLPDRRTDESTGSVSLERANGAWKETSTGKRYFTPDGTYTPLRGDELANARMKAETKAKRRATLSICGLSMLDETEVETVSSARRVKFDHETGELLEREEPPTPPQAPRAAAPKATARQPANGSAEKHPIEEYWAQWQQLVAGARSHGLTPPALATDASKADIIAAGTHWRARIGYKVTCDKAEALGIPFKALADSASAVELMSATRELAAKVTEAESIIEAEAPMASGADEAGSDAGPDF